MRKNPEGSINLRSVVETALGASKKVLWDMPCEALERVISSPIAAVKSPLEMIQTIRKEIGLTPAQRVERTAEKAELQTYT